MIPNSKDVRKHFFQHLVWQSDRMLLGDLVFRLEHYRNDDWELGTECFRFLKTKKLMDQYERFWQVEAEFQVENIFELGIFDGGSIVLWFELFQPQKHVAIDIVNPSDSEYFQRYLTTRKLGSQIKTFWNTDQGDKKRLLEIVRSEFITPLDLVIDDASHVYSLTKASFEGLFPLLRPGGLYIIEDWAWAHWKEFQGRIHPWAAEIPLTQLILELIEATGSSTELISNIAIYEGFVAIKKGTAILPTDGTFRLGDHIWRRSTKWTRWDLLLEQSLRFLSRIRRAYRRIVSGFSLQG